MRAARQAEAQALARLRARDPEAAEPLLREACAGYEALGDPGARFAAACRNQLAACVGAQGRHREALDLFEDAAALAGRASGEASPDREVTLENLAEHARGWGAWPRAVAALRQLRALRCERDGPDSSGSWDALAQLGVAAFRAGDRDEAAASWREIVRDGVGPALRGRRADAHTSLGRLALEAEDLAEAREHLEKAAHLVAEVRGEEHPQLADVFTMLGAVMREQEDYQAAEEHLLEGLRLRLESFGQDHPAASESLNSLAVLYRQQGETSKAEDFYRRALKIRAAALGPDSPTLAPLHANLGELYRSVGHPGDAEPHYVRAVELLERAHGGSDPRVRAARRDLEACRGEQAATEAEAE